MFNNHGANRNFINICKYIHEFINNYELVNFDKEKFDIILYYFVIC